MPIQITSPTKDIALINKKLRKLDDLQLTVNGQQSDIETLKGIPVLKGHGAPEGIVAAPVGTFYSRTNGGAGTTLYVKETGGDGATGWVAK